MQQISMRNLFPAKHQIWPVGEIGIAADYDLRAFNALYI